VVEDAEEQGLPRGGVVAGHGQEGTGQLQDPGRRQGGAPKANVLLRSFIFRSKLRRSEELPGSSIRSSRFEGPLV